MASKGIGYEYRRSMIEGGKITRYTKGNPRPELVGNKYAATLTVEQVQRIKALKGSGKTQQQVADEVGVARQSVGSIWLGKQWKDVEVA